MNDFLSGKEESLVVKTSRLLTQLWAETTTDPDNGDVVSDPATVTDLKESITGKTKTYHYVLLTQLLAKAVNPDLDCRSVQAGNFPHPGPFDARTIAHKVVVPFDAEHQNVLGGSAEPYVNNPLRVPGILSDYRGQQKDKPGWDILVRTLASVESSDHPAGTAIVFLRQLLLEIFRLTANAHVDYPLPSRISLYRTIELINRFTAERSGGDRLEAVATALFRTIGVRLGIYDEVRREKVNASDASSGMSGDIECRQQGTLVLVVEVRDKMVTLNQVEHAVMKARTVGVTELLFITEHGFPEEDRQGIHNKTEQEFSSGQNIYTTTMTDLVSAFMVLIGEKGRTDFIRQVGIELDRVQSNILHRKAWANLLRSL